MLSLLLVMLVPLTHTAASSFPASVVDARRPEAARQVRTEQRIIVRIPPGVGRRQLPLTPERTSPRRWRERSAGRCLPLAAIAGFEIEGASSLILFLRDRRLIHADLGRTCSAREFYSGFYVQRAADGQLCAGRDLLLARSGASCSLTALRLIVPTD